MDIDLSKLSANELIELKKKIDAEQKTRDNYTKDYIDRSDGAFKCFRESVFATFIPLNTMVLMLPIVKNQHRKRLIGKRLETLHGA